MKIENEFIPYELALELKELGFVEPCLGYYTSTGYFNSKKELKWRKWQFSYNFQPITNKHLTWKDSKTENVQQVVTPLYQQAFRFFREVKLIECFIKSKYVQRENVGFYFGIDDYEKRDYYSNTYFSYEEAELKCLKKLIEIVKTKL